MHPGWRNQRGTGPGPAVNAATDRSGRSEQTAQSATDSRDDADAKPGGASGSAADKSCRTSGIASGSNTRADAFDD